MKQLALFLVEPEPLVLPDLDQCTSVHFESIEPQENRFRFYTITWQKTLWGEWTIRATWGRIGGFCRSRVTYFPNERALREALPCLVARRLQRGYVPRLPPRASMFSAEPIVARVSAVRPPRCAAQGYVSPAVACVAGQQP